MRIRTLVYIFIGFIVIYMGVAVASSYYTKKRYNDAFDDISKEIEPHGLYLVDRSYDQGLFNSTAKVSLGASKSRDEVVYIGEMKIRTGPWLGRDGIGLSRSDIDFNINKELLEATKSKGGQINGQLIMGYLSGADAVNIQMEPMELYDGSFKMIFHGGVLSYKNKVSHLEMPYFEMSNPFNGTYAQLKDLSFDGKGGLAALGLEFGDATGEFAVKQFLMKETSSAEPIIDIRNLTLTTRNEMHGNLLDTYLDAKFAFRSNSNLLNVNFSATGRDLDYKAFERMGELGEDKEFNWGPKVQEKVLDLLREAIKSSPSFTLNMSVEHKGAVGFAKGSIRVGSISNDDLKMAIELLLMQKLSVQYEVEVPQQLYSPSVLGRDLFIEVKKLIDQGMLYREGRVYRSDFSYDAGKVILNGKPMGGLM